MSAPVRISEAELARIRDRHPHVEQEALDLHVPAIDAARAALKARGVKLSRPHIAAALEAARAADIEARARRIAEFVVAHRYRWTDEYQLQDSLEQVLRTHGTSAVEKEYRLPDGAGRLDFYIDRIAVEVKVKGSPTSVVRQLGRYAKSEHVDAVVLITTAARLSAMPPTIFDKPLVVATLLGDLL